jgi:hypothetical protein
MIDLAKSNKTVKGVINRSIKTMTKHLTDSDYLRLSMKDYEKVQHPFRPASTLNVPESIKTKSHIIYPRTDDVDLL